MYLKENLYMNKEIIAEIAIELNVKETQVENVLKLQERQMKNKLEVLMKYMNTKLIY